MGRQARLSSLKLFFIIAISCLLAGCAIPGSYFTGVGADPTIKLDNGKTHIPIVKLGADNMPTYHKHEYMVGRHDVLNIIVWQHPELTTGVTNSSSSLDLVNNFDLQNQYQQTNDRYKPGILVDNQGNIFFPYAGTVHVVGKTVSQISHMLRKDLSSYIKDPQVSVRVIQFRSKRAYLVGEVRKQEIMPLDDQPTDVVSAISQAGGIGPGANSGSIFIFRWDEGSPKIYWLSLADPTSMMLAEHFILEDRDILYVAPAGVANWNRLISNITPTISSAWRFH